MSPTDPPLWTARHETAEHLERSRLLLAAADLLARDDAEPCHPLVQDRITEAHDALLNAQRVLREQHYLGRATPPDDRPEAIGTASRSYDEAGPTAGLDGTRTWRLPVPVHGAKLRAAVNTPSTRAVGRASVYAGSPPLAPFRQAVDREMAVARERMEAAVLGRPLTPRPALWFRPLPRLASWATRVADRIDWPRCVPGYAGWHRLRARVSSLVHNVVAHPLLELWPSVGERLHQATTPLGPEPEAPGLEVTPDRETIARTVMAGPDTNLAVARQGLGPERAARVRAMAEQTGPVSTVDLQPSIVVNTHGFPTAESPVASALRGEAQRQVGARRVVRDRPQA